MKPNRFATIATVSCLCFSAFANDPPKEVYGFLELRKSCDHWRGEFGYDKERQADIDWSVCQSCQGTDAELARLKKKYRSNTTAMAALDELDEKIEPKDKAAARRFCKSTRKPKWEK
jgi:hypothetical protein